MKQCRSDETVPGMVDEVASRLDRLERMGSESDLSLLEIIEQMADHETRAEISAALARHYDVTFAKPAK